MGRSSGRRGRSRRRTSTPRRRRGRTWRRSSDGSGRWSFNGKAFRSRRESARRTTRQSLSRRRRSRAAVRRARRKMTKTKRLKSKVCLVGEKAVGKTSLIRRYVIDMFDEQYLTTIGTRVTKKELRLPMLGHDLVVDLDMTISDIMGEKGFRELLKDAYFYGTNGVLAVADLSRRRTLDDLDDWIDSVEQVVGKVPILIVVNKVDLTSNARFQERDVAQFAKAYGAEFFLTSAKTGDQVETAFARLGALVVEHQLHAT